MQNHARFSLTGGVLYEPLGAGEDAVLLSMESDYLYRCNHTAAAMLELLERNAIFEETVARLPNQFGVESAVSGHYPREHGLRMGSPSRRSRTRSDEGGMCAELAGRSLARI